jgi:hypothetical protein
MSSLIASLAIFATCARAAMDAVFLRRMQIIVTFP